MPITSENTTESQTLLRTFGLTFSQATMLPPISNDWHQFVVSLNSPLSIQSGGASWLIPPHAGLWIPAGVGCALRNRTVMTLRMIYFPKHEPIHPDFEVNNAKAIEVTPLLRELIQRSVFIGALVRAENIHESLFNLIRHELQNSKTLRVSLIEPTSVEAMAVVRCLELHSFAIGQLEPAIEKSGFSRRTIERHFLEQTNLSLGRWVRRRRCILAAELLSAGETASEVALELGYSTPSAFTEMMKSELGVLPRDLSTNSSIPK